MREQDRKDRLLKVAKYFTIVLSAVVVLTLLESCKSDEGISLDDHEDVVDTLDQLPGDSSDTASYFPYCVEDPMDSLFQTGCFEIFFVKHLDTISQQAVSVRIDTSLVTIGTECQTLDLPMEGVIVQLLTAGDDPDSIYFYFCNGITNTLVAEPLRDTLANGKLTIGASENLAERDSAHFEISAILDSATFRSDQKDTTIYNVIFYKISQGWEPV